MEITVMPEELERGDVILGWIGDDDEPVDVSDQLREGWEVDQVIVRPEDAPSYRRHHHGYVQVTMADGYIAFPELAQVRVLRKDDPAGCTSDAEPDTVNTSSSTNPETQGHSDMSDTETKDVDTEYWEKQYQAVLQNLETQRDETRRARRQLTELQENVTEILKRLVEESELTRDYAKEIAEELGVRAPVNKFTVTMQVEVVIEGIEADDDADAERNARDLLDLTIMGGDYDSDHWDIDNVEVVED